MYEHLWKAALDSYNSQGISLSEIEGSEVSFF